MPRSPVAGARAGHRDALAPRAHGPAPGAPGRRSRATGDGRLVTGHDRAIAGAAGAVATRPPSFAIFAACVSPAPADAARLVSPLPGCQETVNAVSSLTNDVCCEVSSVPLHLSVRLVP